MHLNTYLYAALFFLFFAFIGSEGRFFVLEKPITNSIKIEKQSTAFEKEQVQLRTYSSVAIEEVASHALNIFENGNVLAVEQYLDNLDEQKASLVLKELLQKLDDINDYKSIINMLEQHDTQSRIYEGNQFIYARALAREGATEDAIAAYKLLVKEQPYHQSGAINLGILLNRNEQYQLTIDLLKPSLIASAGRKKAKLLSIVGASYEALQDWKNAATHYTQSINIRPGHASTWLNLAQMQREMKLDYPTAVQSFERTISLSPKQHRARYELGQFALENGDFELAKEVLQSALELQPGHSKTHMYLAWVHFELQSFNDSLKHWQWILQHSASKSSKRTATHMLAIINDNQQVIAPLKKRQVAKPYIEALSLIKQRKWQAALKSLDQISHENPFYLRALMRKHLILSENNEPEKYQEVYDRIKAYRTEMSITSSIVTNTCSTIKTNIPFQSMSRDASNNGLLFNKQCSFEV